MCSTGDVVGFVTVAMVKEVLWRVLSSLETDNNKNDFLPFNSIAINKEINLWLHHRGLSRPSPAWQQEENKIIEFRRRQKFASIALEAIPWVTGGVRPLASCRNFAGGFICPQEIPDRCHS